MVPSINSMKLAKAYLQSTALRMSAQSVLVNMSEEGGESVATRLRQDAFDLHQVADFLEHQIAIRSKPDPRAVKRKGKSR